MTWRRLARAAIFFTILPVVTCVAAFGQESGSHDALLDHLAGKWLLQGMIGGRKVIHDIEAGWVLDGRYMRFHEIARERNARNEPAYEAIVFIGWEQATKQYSCVWLDDTGVISPGSSCTAKRRGDELPFLFLTKAGTFHTTFIYRRMSDIWEWRMDADENGVLRPFARMTLMRQK